MTESKIASRLRDRYSKEVVPALQKEFLEGLGAHNDHTTRQLPAGIDRFSRHLGAPSAEGVEILQGEAQGIQARMTGRAVGILAVLVNRIGEDGLAAALDQIRKDVNHRLPDYMAVTKFRVHPEEFAKTPKKSIKRYLYMKE